MKKAAPTRRIRLSHRKSSPTGMSAELPLVDISKPFEDASFQAVYQRITREMHINMLPSKKRQRYLVEQSNTNIERRRNHTEVVEECCDRRLYYSVERTRNQLAGAAKNVTPKPATHRRTHSTMKFVSRLRQSESTATAKEQEADPLQQLITSEMLVATEFEFLVDLINHFKRFDSILKELKKFSAVESVIGVIRSYILDDEDSSMSQFHTLFLADRNKHQAKAFLFLERVAVLLIVEETIRKKLQFEVVQLRHILSLVQETYVGIFTVMLRSQPAYLLDSGCLSWVESVIVGHHNSDAGVLFKHNDSLHRRISTLLRHSKDFQCYFNSELSTAEKVGINMAFYKLLEFYAFHLASLMPTADPLVGFLATCPSPYLHHMPTKKYTLVLDLDETLVHYNYRNNLSQFKIRPYCQEFIFEMSEYFEVGIFTCGMQDYADWVTSHLRGIEFKLYRHHAVQTSTGFIKDLARLGRDLKKTVILDNLSHNFQLQKENGIEIAAWFGDVKDTALLDVIEILKFVVGQRPEDVREGLRLAAKKISSMNSLKYHI